MDNPIVASARHLDAPWIAANLAVLNEAALDVRLDVDLRMLAAKRARHQKLIWHFGIVLQCWSASHASPTQSLRSLRSRVALARRRCGGRSTGRNFRAGWPETKTLAFSSDEKAAFCHDDIAWLKP